MNFVILRRTIVSQLKSGNKRKTNFKQNQAKSVEHVVLGFHNTSQVLN